MNGAEGHYGAGMVNPVAPTSADRAHQGMAPWHFFMSSMTSLCQSPALPLEVRPCACERRSRKDASISVIPDQTLKACDESTYRALLHGETLFPKDTDHTLV